MSKRKMKRGGKAYRYELRRIEIILKRTAAPMMPARIAVAMATTRSDEDASLPMGFFDSAGGSLASRKILDCSCRCRVILKF